MAVKRMLAVDIGANSGRIILGEYDGSRIHTCELLRFSHRSAEIRGELFWDFPDIWNKVRDGLTTALKEIANIDSIGIDSFCPDFCCFDRQGRLLGQMKSYRNYLDERSLSGILGRVSADEFWEITGNAPLSFGLLPQIMQLQAQDENVRAGNVMLLPLSNALNYLLGGEACTDFTQVSVSMLFNRITKTWDEQLCSRFLLHRELLPPVKKCGTVLGKCLLGRQENAPLIVNVGSHDTALANLLLASMEDNAIYINTGTWTSVGVKVAEPVTHPAARKYGVNNYGLPDEQYILCKTAMGMWFLQECRRCWAEEGTEPSFAQLSHMAESACSAGKTVDLQESRFLNAYRTLPEVIGRELCRLTGRSRVTRGEIVRCIYDHLTGVYQTLIAQLEEITHRSYSTIVLGGGAVQDKFFCRQVKERCGKRVIPASTEATALGNILMQLEALGEPLSCGQRKELLMNSMIEKRL